MANTPITVLVTRPAEQAGELISALKASGFDCLHQPMIRIEPNTSDEHALKNAFMNLDQYHSVICVSANAATMAVDWIDQYWPQTPVGLNWYAVGPSSARPFEILGVYPTMPDDHRTEGLLALKGLQAFDHHEKILILRGQAGRETLAQTLSDRGAQINYAPLYKRMPVALSNGQLINLLDQHKPQYAIATSNAILDQLVAHLGQSSWLHTLPIIVPSERNAHYARALGASKLHVSHGADPQSLVNALQILVER